MYVSVSEDRKDMASTPEKLLIKAGSILSVEVEHALDDVLMVCLRNGDKIFRGILLDSDKGACPIGIPSKDVLSDNLNSKFGVPVQETATVEAIALTPSPQSALSHRQSYFQDMPLPPARPLFCSKTKSSFNSNHGKPFSRSNRVKLRPRNVFCSKCKAECAKKPSAKRKLLSTSDNIPRKKPLIMNDSRTDFKTIKISFATPQGKDHVTISPKPQNGGSSKKTVSSSTHKPVMDISKKVKKAKAVLKNKNTELVKKQVVLNGFHSSSQKGASSEKKKRKLENLESNGKIRIIKSKGVYKSAPLKENSQVVKIAPVKSSVDKKPMKQTNGSKVIKSSTSSKVKPVKKLNSAKPTSKKTSDKPKPSPVNGSLQVSLSKLKDTSKSANKISLDKTSVTLAVSNVMLLSPHEKKPMDSCSESSFTSSTCSRNSSIKDKNCKNKGKLEFDIRKADLSDSEIDFKFKRDVNSNKQKMHKKNVTQTYLADGRKMCLGDIVWGKIAGSPWWPGRIARISICREDNGTIMSQEAVVRWFAASTVSTVPLHELNAFLPCFNQRFNKKRRGSYKTAISQAIAESKAFSSEVRELNTMFETSQIC